MLDFLNLLDNSKTYSGIGYRTCWMPWVFRRRNRSEAALAEQEHQLREREAEHAEALAALEISRKTLQEAASFVQVR